ncbi:MAG TPA: SusD/RagB family nutrient-binding outer membrane lipoprotein [Bacteroidales bacterium]|nr:SusD/RagB family nutrient-binding outer membrane lipoprotein [Bacteroidales bacterium]
MKKFIDITKGLLIASLMSAALVSCSEDIMDDVNEDINHSKDAQSKFILTDVITSTAFNVVGGDFNTYASSYIEHEVGTYNQLYRAEHRESDPSAASTFNNVWGSSYAALKNARIIIEKCSEGGAQEGNYVTRGMAEVMAALNSAIITDMFGDTPWSEAALINPDGTPRNMNPKIDRQQDIYAGIMKYLDDAIIDLQKTDTHASGSVGGNDLLYGGRKASWLQLAYGLKARYTMRLLARSTDVPGDLQKVIDYANLSFTSAGQQAAFAIYGASNLNPLFDFQWSRDYLAASQSMSEKLSDRNDPRLRRVFISADWVQMTGTDDPDFFMAPNGENSERQYFYNTSVFVFSQSAPTLLLSYHEVLFLKAEALVRLGRLVEAKQVLKQAVTAAIANTEVSVSAAMSAPNVIKYGGLTETTDAITPAEAGTYFDTKVDPLFTANPLKETMIQKYIAFFGASGESTECYSDIRRMKALNENFVELKNPENASKFPLRAPYGSDDTTTNPEVQAAYGDGQYVYTKPVWWAGGNN